MTETDGESITISSPSTPTTIAIMSDAGRRLLTLDRVDGRLVATYDPADLDEAAQQFVRAVERIG